MQREDLKDLSREQLERLICDWAVKYYDYKNRLMFSGGSQSIRLSSGKSVSSTGNGMQIQIGNNDGYSYVIVCGPDNIVICPAYQPNSRCLRYI